MFDTLIAAVDFSAATTAVITVFAAIAGILIVMKGAKYIIGALR